MASDDEGALTRATARFGDYLDALPGRLLAELECVARDPTDAEAKHLAGSYDRQFVSTTVIEPNNFGAAPLLLGRFNLDGGYACVLAIGVHNRIEIPDSYAQASDVRSDWMMEEANSFVRTVVDGCTEFCRPFEHTNVMEMLATYGPPSTPQWLVGVESQHGKTSRSSEEAHEPFEQRWRPWQWRV